MSADHDKNRADLQKDPARVSGMFDQVAKNYDRTNTVLSMGNDRMWRVATTRAVAPRRGQRILDLAAGTGARMGWSTRPVGTGAGAASGRPSAAGSGSGGSIAREVLSVGPPRSGRGRQA